MFSRLRNFLQKKTVKNPIIESMATLRYFINIKPDFKSEYVHPEIPELQLKESINDIATKIEHYVKPVERNAGDGIYLGTAGIAYMFYHLSKVPTLNENKNEYLNKALEYLKPAIVVASHSTSNRKDAPSFILGNCGIYAVAAAIYKAIGDTSQSNHYRQLYYEAANVCKEPKFLNCGSDELFVGRAGYILGAIWLSKETKTPLQKQDIYELCKIMIASGKEYATRQHCPCPLMYAYYQVEYLGAAHGLCSILQVLLSVPGFLDSHPSEANDIKTTIDFLLSLQTKEGNFPAAMDEVDHRSDLIHWCHGAPGVIYLMAKAYLVFRQDKYLESCKQMADLIWDKGLLKKGPGLCHGVAGNGYVFLLLYRLTKGEHKYLYRAIRFNEFMNNDEFKHGARMPDHPYSLYEGLAGTACFLADLSYPFKAAFPFSDVF